MSGTLRVDAPVFVPRVGITLEPATQGRLDKHKYHHPTPVVDTNDVETTVPKRHVTGVDRAHRRVSHGKQQGKGNRASRRQLNSLDHGQQQYSSSQPLPKPNSKHHHGNTANKPSSRRRRGKPCADVETAQREISLVVGRQERGIESTTLPTTDRPAKAAFPPLVSPITPSYNQLIDPTTHGGATSIWFSTSEATSRIRHAPHIVNDDASSNKGGDGVPQVNAYLLTPLVAIKKEKMGQRPIVDNGADSFDTSRSHPTERASNGVLHPSTTVSPSTSDLDDEAGFQSQARPVAIHMGKLRNRWWDLLQQHSRTLLEREQQTKAKANTPRLDQTSVPDATSPSWMEPRAEPIRVPICTSNGSDDDVLTNTSSPSRTMDERSSRINPMCRDEHYSTIVGNIVDSIHRSDGSTMKGMLEVILTIKEPKYDKSTVAVSALQLSTFLDKPSMVQILCHNGSHMYSSLPLSCDVALYKDFSIEKHIQVLTLPPLLIAATFGLDECLQILLSALGSSALTTLRDEQGNTVLHYCCRGGLNCNIASQMLSRLLNHVVSTSSSSASSATGMFFKVMSSRNNREQTPLHVACEYGQADIVDMILNHRLTANLSMLSKLLALVDLDQQTPLLAAVASASTDIVMSLLMWRGNNVSSKNTCWAPTSGAKSRSKSAGSHVEQQRVTNPTRPPCPLTWAVRSWNLEMVLLLLEFDNPVTQSVYDLHSALYTVILETDNATHDSTGCRGIHQESREGIIRALVNAGANPCSLQEEPPVAAANKGMVRGSIATLATHNESETCLATLLDTYEKYLTHKQSARRRDPKLQNQSESFFTGIESVERMEQDMALRDALVTALFHAWLGFSANKESASHYTACCISLYKRGLTLGASDLLRLKASLSQQRLSHPHFEIAILPLCPASYETTVTRTLPSLHNDGKFRDELLPWSCVMTTMPWFSIETCACAWLQTAEWDPGVETWPNTDVILVSNEGNRFTAHACVLSQSDKLAAAIRFAGTAWTRCTPETDDGSHDLEIPLDLSSRACLWLLEHLYHGSILTGIAGDERSACQSLLDLMVIGEEFICHSLVQECEMRLLSSEQSNKCFCSRCTATPGRHVQRNGDEVTYAIRVKGPGSLVTASTAIDILSVIQHLTEGCSVFGYTLRTSPDGHVKGLVSRQPLESLQDAVWSAMLSDFGSVWQSAAFREQLDDASADRLLQSMLLQMSLEDLAQRRGPNGANPVGPRHGV